jgi:hypothetical protein
VEAMLGILVLGMFIGVTHAAYSILEHLDS